MLVLVTVFSGWSKLEGVLVFISVKFFIFVGTLVYGLLSIINKLFIINNLTTSHHLLYASIKVTITLAVAYLIDNKQMLIFDTQTNKFSYIFSDYYLHDRLRK